MIQQYIVCSWVHPNIGNSVGEKILIGILTCAIIELFFVCKRKKKKAREQNIRIKADNASYENLVRNIAQEYVSSMGHIKIDTEAIRALLVERCNPKNYIEEYNHHKLEAASKLYIKLKDTSIKIPLSQILAEAEKDLNIYLNSTDLYKKLEEIFNPANFTEDRFDEAKLMASNRAYKFIQDNRNSLRKLLEFAQNANLTQNTILKDKIPIACNFELDNNSRGRTVKICGIYPMEFKEISDDAYIFYQINDNNSYLKDPDLRQYLKSNNINRNYLKIPITVCHRYAPSKS